jgi:hypothetical protein
MKRSSSHLVAAALVASLGSMAAASEAFSDVADRPAQRRQRQNIGSVSVGHRRKSTLHSTNGAREVARRLRQIEAGTLRVSA